MRIKEVAKTEESMRFQYIKSGECYRYVNQDDEDIYIKTDNGNSVRLDDGYETCYDDCYDREVELVEAEIHILISKK